MSSSVVPATFSPHCVCSSSCDGRVSSNNGYFSEFLPGSSAILEQLTEVLEKNLWMDLIFISLLLNYA